MSNRESSTGSGSRPSSHGGNANSRPRVLIIDDDRGLCWLVRDSLLAARIQRTTSSFWRAGLTVGVFEWGRVDLRL